MASTTSNTGIVRGSVCFYNADKKFGFVEVLPADLNLSVMRVFFHQSACREVDGTPEEPIFTNRRSDKAPSWWKGMRHSEEIILRVVAGPKGPMAAVWGYRPKRTWLESLQHHNDLACYAAGHVEIHWSKREHGPVQGELVCRLVEAPLLEPTTGGPEDPWRLTLQCDVYNGISRRYDPPTHRETITVQLERWGDHADRNLHYGRMAIVHYDPSRDEWMRIVFYPEGSWFGWEPGNQYDSPYKHRQS